MQPRAEGETRLSKRNRRLPQIPDGRQLSLRLTEPLPESLYRPRLRRFCYRLCELDLPVAWAERALPNLAGAVFARFPREIDAAIESGDAVAFERACAGLELNAEEITATFRFLKEVAPKEEHHENQEESEARTAEEVAIPPAVRGLDMQPVRDHAAARRKVVPELRTC